MYAFLLAKQNNGVFSLRIEDTDRARFVPGSIEDIVENMKWLGLNFDGELILQSKRQDIYAQYAKELMEKGLAYESEGAIWFKMSKTGKIAFTDLVGQRRVEFDLSTQKDFVLLKSDGFPTYHLAHVIDDHLMETNPVIRAEEWLSSTPKHIATFQAFGWEVPQYAHLPLILGTDRSKLSKRHGAKGVLEFRQDGFLPEVVLNYMALLGWTPPSGKEILTLEEMIKEFNLKDVHISPAVFNLTKLEWMNGEYIRKMSDEDLNQRLQEFLVDHPAKDKIALVVPLIKERIKKLSDFVPLTDFLWEEPEYDLTIFQKSNIKNQKDVLLKIAEEMENLKTPWASQEFEATFRKLAEDLGIKAGDLFQLIRIAISSQLVTPPLLASMRILGEEKSLKRIRNVLRRYPNF